jgi:hypothetical protein
MKEWFVAWLECFLILQFQLYLQHAGKTNYSVLLERNNLTFFYFFDNLIYSWGLGERDHVNPQCLEILGDGVRASSEIWVAQAVSILIAYLLLNIKKF